MRAHTVDADNAALMCGICFSIERPEWDLILPLLIVGQKGAALSTMGAPARIQT